MPKKKTRLRVLGEVRDAAVITRTVQQARACITLRQAVERYGLDAHTLIRLRRRLIGRQATPTNARPQFFRIADIEQALWE